MAKIVSAFAISHAAVMLRQWDQASQTNRDAVETGRLEIANRLLASKPDVVVLVGNDHYQSFFLDNMPAFCLGLGGSSTGWGDGNLPPYELAVDNKIASALLDGLIDKGFDMAYSRDMPLDHAFITPVHMLMPRANISVVPLFQNCIAPPLPTVKRCLQLGAAMREVLDGLDPQLRIALIATGGLSHEIPIPEWQTISNDETDIPWLEFMSRGRYRPDPDVDKKIGAEISRWSQSGIGHINEDFDQEILLLLENGNYADLANYSYTKISQRAGNGGQEIRNWATVAGALPGTTTETLFYQAVPEWLTGVAGVAFKLGN